MAKVRGNQSGGDGDYHSYDDVVNDSVDDYQEPYHRQGRRADSRDRNPRDRDPRDRDPRDRDPRDSYPRERDPRERDPRDTDLRDSYPRERDPRDRHSRDREPRGRDPRDRDPRDVDPCDRHSRGRDPRGRDPYGERDRHRPNHDDCDAANRDGDRERKRRNHSDSPEQGDGKRGYSSPLRGRDIDYPPTRGSRSGGYPPSDGRGNRDFPPSEDYRSRDVSPSDRYRNRDNSPSDRYRNRDNSPSDRYRNRDISPSDRHNSRDRDQSNGRKKKGFLPSSDMRKRDYSPSEEINDYSPTEGRGRRHNEPSNGYDEKDYSPSAWGHRNDYSYSPSYSPQGYPSSDRENLENANETNQDQTKKNKERNNLTNAKDKISNIFKNIASKFSDKDQSAGNGKTLTNTPDNHLEPEVLRGGGLEVNTNGLDGGVQTRRPRGTPPTHHSHGVDKTPSVSQGSVLTLEWPEVAGKDTAKLVYGQDENEERGNWTGRFDFILSMLGYAVGLGNVWRFPYLCYRNGGGAFLFPFLLMMVVIGLPLFYLEASLGQFSSCGAMTCWDFAPLFKGIGVGMVIVSALTGIYYNMILGWSLRYLFASFSGDVPFASCNNDWNSKDCKLLLPSMECEGNLRMDYGLCTDGAGKEVGLWNSSLFTEVTGRKLKSPAQEYWKYVLDFSPGIEHFGQPKWDLVLCLLLAWIICFFCLIKGIKTTGKVVYFTAIFPYVVLFILFFRGVTLDHAIIGIRYFIIPDFGRLLDANVWKDAANQIFFSMSIAGGGLITLSSYNRFHNNILRDSLIVAIGDSLTCVLGGFVIFSFLGSLAGDLGLEIKDVATEGAGLAFEVYPEAVSSLPPTTMWAILFFLMLLTLGLDSQFAMIETVLTGVLDQYPNLRPRKTLVILSICCLLFLLGLPLTCPGGMYLLQLMDNYVGGMTLIILGFFELVAVVYVYGFQRFCRDINLMTGSTQFIFWRVTWCVVSPLTIGFIFVYMFIDYSPSTYGDDYTYPVWADVFGWLFTLASAAAIPVTMVYKICQETEGDTYFQKVKLLCMPSVYWGPALQKHRKLVTYVADFQVDPKSDVKPETSFVNLGFTEDPPGQHKLKMESRDVSLGTSRVSMVSNVSRGTLGSTHSGKSKRTYETNV
ncbi:sodium- and chloride-dependent glycine transporter 1 [Aplysia californica]|uniref:Transporter n=1 Tax=Aplysia californica TaxID=6500 RepID=A0ABM1A458_APLCA|nr:sodium- and chloride-dependent glycine transporter 1 [Aplysia californica]